MHMMHVPDADASALNTRVTWLPRESGLVHAYPGSLFGEYTAFHSWANNLGGLPSLTNQRSADRERGNACVAWALITANPPALPSQSGKCWIIATRNFKCTQEEFTLSLLGNVDARLASSLETSLFFFR